VAETASFRKEHSSTLAYFCVKLVYWIYAVQNKQIENTANADVGNVIIGDPSSHYNCECEFFVCIALEIPSAARRLPSNIDHKKYK